MRKIFIFIALLAITLPARAEIGKTVEDFENSSFYKEMELSFYTIASAATKQSIYIKNYYKSEKEGCYYYVFELLTKKGENNILSQTLNFSGEVKNKDIHMVGGFINEAIGKEENPDPALNEMFKEVSHKLEEMTDEERKQKAPFSQRNMHQYKVNLKYTSAGDWVVTVAK